MTEAQWIKERALLDIEPETQDRRRTQMDTVDRDGKPCGPTLLACSCCGAGKGEEHRRSCYVWSDKWRAHRERVRAASYGTSPFMQALREERERVRLTPGRVPG
jgi:hypothetical protein